VTEVKIDDLTQFLQVIDTYHKPGWIYRGVTDSSFTLIPKIGRKECCPEYSLNTERLLLRVFKQRAIRHVTPQPSCDLEWLALGQHHGLPTRLLDWS
jgi:FRG domain